MKKYLLIAFVFTSVCSFGQDSLSKYSYALMSLNQPKSILGSGFFIKTTENLYFITARHCVVNCESTNSNDILVINRFNPQKSFIINTEKIKLKYPCHGTFFDSDYVAIKVDTQLKKSINSVENFLSPVFKKVDSASIFGFPGFSYSGVKNGQVFILPTQMKLPKKIYGFYIKTDSLKQADSASCFFEVDPFLNNMDSLGGFSGSPIFIMSNNKIRILGVLFGAGNNQNGRVGIWYTPIEFVQRETKKMN